MITVGCGREVVVVLGGSVVVGGRVVVVVAGSSDVLVSGGCVGTATLFPLSSSFPPSATKATRPIAHSAITAPATMRAAVTSCVPLRVPRERRIASAARDDSTRATIVPIEREDDADDRPHERGDRERLDLGLLAPTARACPAARGTSGFRLGTNGDRAGIARIPRGRSGSGHRFTLPTGI